MWHFILLFSQLLTKRAQFPVNNWEDISSLGYRMEKAGLCCVIAMAATFPIRIYIRSLRHIEMNAFGSFHHRFYNFELGNFLSPRQPFAPGETEAQIYGMTCSWPFSHEWQGGTGTPVFCPPSFFFPHSVLPLQMDHLVTEAGTQTEARAHVQGH